MKPGRIVRNTLFTALATLVPAWASAEVCRPSLHPLSHGVAGYGAATRGGDPDDTIEVTNGNDAGPGSLRAALETGAASGKTVTFAAEVDSIVLTSEISPTGLTHCTIDGFSSPDSTIKIILRGDPDNAVNKSPGENQAAIELKGTRGCHDVIIAGLRFVDSDLDNYVRFIEGFENGVVSHCSFRGNDGEQIGISEDGGDRGPPRNLTIQYCLFNEASTARPDDEGRMMAVMIGCGTVTFWRNLMAAGVRMPRVHTNGGPVQIAENVVYDWDPHAVNISKGGTADVVRNVFVPGPTTDASDLPRAIYLGKGAGPVYRAGNEFVRNRHGRPSGSRGSRSEPVCAAEFPTIEDVAAEVVAHAGCPLMTDGAWARDAVDQATVDALGRDLR